MTEIKDRPKGGLKVREHGTYGVYVEGLKSLEVKSQRELEKRVE